MRVDPNNYKDMGAIQLRKEVRSLIKSANAILVENEYTNIQNARYFLRDLHITSRGGVTTNKGTERLSKAESMTAIKQLANFINADMSSESYKEYEKNRRSDAMEKAKETFKKNHPYKAITDDDWESYFEIKDEFPELFDNDHQFYLEILKTSRTIRRRREKTNEPMPSIMQTILDVKREFKANDEIVTPAKLKSEVIKRAQKR